MFVKEWPLEYKMVTKTYIPSNLCDSSDSSDSFDSSDCSDSSDSSESSNSSDSSEQKKIVCPKKHFFLQYFLTEKNFSKKTQQLKLL